jgi:hypothetical protein
MLAAYACGFDFSKGKNQIPSPVNFISFCALPSLIREQTARNQPASARPEKTLPLGTASK